MTLPSLLQGASGRAIFVASLFVVAGCSGGGEPPAPPPNITVNPLAAPPVGSSETNAGPGSNAATDSTLN